jgi:uncharacterized protein YggE
MKERRMSRPLLVALIFALIGSLASGPSVLAQAAPSERTGITTTGHGLASVPAETAVLQILINSSDYYGGPPQAPQVEATPGATARTTMEPIVAVIEAHDSVESVSVVIPVPIGSLGRQTAMARLDIEVSAPAVDDLTGLLNDVARAAGEDRLMIGYVGASFGVADCQTLERDARQAAMEDAQARATVQADVLGIELGDVIASVDVETTAVSTYYGLIPGASSNCEPASPLNNLLNAELGATLPMFDPVSQSPVVEVYREIQVTFAIDDGGATPAA